MVSVSDHVTDSARLRAHRVTAAEAEVAAALAQLDDVRDAAVREAEADLAAAQAQLGQAQLDSALWWVAVLAPWAVSTRPRPAAPGPPAVTPLPLPLQRAADRERRRRDTTPPPTPTGPAEVGPVHPLRPWRPR